MLRLSHSGRSFILKLKDQRLELQEISLHITFVQKITNLVMKGSTMYHNVFFFLEPGNFIKGLSPNNTGEKP